MTEQMTEQFYEFRVKGSELYLIEDRYPYRFKPDASKAERHKEFFKGNAMGLLAKLPDYVEAVKVTKTVTHTYEPLTGPDLT